MSPWLIVYEFLLLVSASCAANKSVNIHTYIYKDTDSVQPTAKIATVPDISEINLVNNFTLVWSILTNLQYNL